MQTDGSVLFPPEQVHIEFAPVMHPNLQPWSSFVPSSQVSEPNSLPSPQIGVQTLGVADVHVHSGSTLHLAEHPSPSNTLLFSHSSTGYLVPSPHRTQFC